METKFQVGNAVFCAHNNAHGTVVGLEGGVGWVDTSIYPVVVRNDFGDEVYTADGRYTEDGPVVLTLIAKALTWREYRGWHVATLGDSWSVRVAVSEVRGRGEFWIECKAVGILPQTVEADTLDGAKRAALKAVSARLGQITNLINNQL